MKIEMEGVYRTYPWNGGTVTALEDINLSVRKGEFIVFLGPTGCGKSTLIHLVAGLQKADRGTIRVDGREVAGPGQDRVVMFQDSALFPWLTVLGNVEFGLKMANLGLKERRERALEYLRMVHLGRFVNAYPHELSGGMRQRAALARSLVMDPDVLLMDEPFSALDAQTRNLLQTELEAIWRKTKKTILFVTHNVREATFLADRVFEMTARPGRIKREHSIAVPRPRMEGDAALVVIQNKIMASLKIEIEKVAQQEMDTSYHVSKKGVVTPANRNLGSHI
jgi:NitT/TauT family transport system ATP-binding protein